MVECSTAAYLNGALTKQRTRYGCVLISCLPAKRALICVKKKKHGGLFAAVLWSIRRGHVSVVCQLSVLLNEKCLNDGSHLGLCVNIFACLFCVFSFGSLQFAESLCASVCQCLNECVLSPLAVTVLCWRGTVCFLPSTATPNQSHIPHMHAKRTQTPRPWPLCPWNPIGHLSPRC